MQLRRQFFTYWTITTFQTLNNKIDELIDMIDSGEFPSLSLESSVTSVQYVCYLYEENKSGSSVNVRITI